MFRSNVFEPTLTGIPYRLFIEGLKSPVTKAAYTFALQKYMKFLRIAFIDYLVGRKSGYYWPSPIPSYQNREVDNKIDYARLTKEEILRESIRRQLQ